MIPSFRVLRAEIECICYLHLLSSRIFKIAKRNYIPKKGLLLTLPGLIESQYAYTSVIVGFLARNHQIFERMPKMDNFNGKVSIVTGAASGIGKALCEELGRKKAVVVAADINTEGVRKVASKISKDGGKSIAAYLDVSQSEDVAEFINKTANEYGRLDYIFNNAGISVWGEVRDMDLSQWEKVIAVNLMGVVYGTSAS